MIMDEPIALEYIEELERETGLTFQGFQVDALVAAATMGMPKRRCLFYKTGAGKSYTSLGQLRMAGHTEAVVTGSLDVARRFTTELDAAALMVNASTRFTDGEELGFGAEIGISTQKLHARGPMGLPELTSTKYVVTGTGHTR